MEYINKIFNDDCLKVMDQFIENGIKFSCIIADLPYGTTSCSWDEVIPFEVMWSKIDKLITDTGAVVLFGTEPFSSYLRLSNIKEYKYDYKWIKSKVGNFLNCKNSPLKKYEDIMVFSKGTIANGSPRLMTYNPQGLIEINKTCSNKGKSRKGTTIEERPSRQGTYTQKYTNYPNNLLEFKSEDGYHPTQKPVPLLEFLIKTYSNENDCILDFTCGSGSTLCACINTGRCYTGIEKEKKYYDISVLRTEQLLNNKNNNS